MLDKYALLTGPNFGLDKLKYSLLLRQKLYKVRKYIISLEVLNKNLDFNCILELLFFKNYANHLVNVFIAYTKSNIAKNQAPTQFQHFFLCNSVNPDIQKPRKRSKFLEYIHQANKNRQGKKRFQINVSKPKKQKCAALEI